MARGAGAVPLLENIFSGGSVSLKIFFLSLRNVYTSLVRLSLIGFWLIKFVPKISVIFLNFV